MGDDVKNGKLAHDLYNIKEFEMTEIRASSILQCSELYRL